MTGGKGPRGVMSDYVLGGKCPGGKSPDTTMVTGLGGVSLRTLAK